MLPGSRRAATMKMSMPRMNGSQPIDPNSITACMSKAPVRGHGWPQRWRYDGSGSAADPALPVGGANLSAGPGRPGANHVKALARNRRSQRSRPPRGACEVRHTTTLHGLAGIESRSHRRRLVADAAHAVGLPELGALGDELDLTRSVGELAQRGAVGQVRTVGARPRHLGITDRPALGVAPGAVDVEEHLRIDRGLALGLHLGGGVVRLLLLCGLR